MYPSTPTETEKLNQRISEQAASMNERMIKSYIEANANRVTKMREGVRYYENENDILNRKQYAIIDDVKVIDEEKANNRIPHGWHKLLVDQKTAYLVGQPINFAADDKKFTEWINEYLGEQWDDVANELVKNASNKGIEWLHPYIDEEGEFDYIITPGEQIIPVYEDHRKKKLLYIIRYYPTMYVDEEAIRVELWDSKQVNYYILVRGEVMRDPSVEANPDSHFYYNDKGYGWERVPFIPFRNNEQEKSDLAYYKHLIDAFDNRVSDNQNSFDDIQELIFILRGYDGENLSEFMRNLKLYKAIKTDSEGGVDTLQAEVPMTSIDSHLNRLRESIFTFGGGVDVGNEKFGNSPSGIALKFLYSLLDMKSNTLERKFRQGIQQLLWFLCEYLSISGKGDYDYKEVDFTFKRSMMVNELEAAQIATQSKGIISDKTILKNHPWVDDMEQELEYLEEEKAAYVDLEAVNTNVTPGQSE